MAGLDCEPLDTFDVIKIMLAKVVVSFLVVPSMLVTSVFSVMLVKLGNIRSLVETKAMAFVRKVVCVVPVSLLVLHLFY